MQEDPPLGILRIIPTFGVTADPTMSRGATYDVDCCNSWQLTVCESVVKRETRTTNDI